MYKLLQVSKRYTVAPGPGSSLGDVGSPVGRAATATWAGQANPIMVPELRRGGWGERMATVVDPDGNRVIVASRAAGSGPAM
jgi:hypothetical protein